MLLDVELPPEVSGMAFDPESTAVILGISRVTLWRRKKTLGLSQGDEPAVE